MNNAGEQQALLLDVDEIAEIEALLARHAASGVVAGVPDKRSCGNSDGVAAGDLYWAGLPRPGWVEWGVPHPEVVQDYLMEALARVCRG